MQLIPILLTEVLGDVTNGFMCFEDEEHCISAIKWIITVWPSKTMGWLIIVLHPLYQYFSPYEHLRGHPFPTGTAASLPLEILFIWEAHITPNTTVSKHHMSSSEYSLTTLCEVRKCCFLILLIEIEAQAEVTWGTCCGAGNWAPVSQVSKWTGPSSVFNLRCSHVTTIGAKSQHCPLRPTTPLWNPVLWECKLRQRARKWLA